MLSAVGMFFVVFGILQAGTNNVLFVICLVVGIVSLAGFFLYIRRRERAGKEALLSTGLFRNRTCNLALVTQNIQWLLLMGISFVVSVFLQEVRGYNAIRTGVSTAGKRSDSENVRLIAPEQLLQLPISSSWWSSSWLYPPSSCRALVLPFCHPDYYDGAPSRCRHRSWRSIRRTCAIHGGSAQRGARICFSE